jgi:hypothetical protein
MAMRFPAYREAVARREAKPVQGRCIRKPWRQGVPAHDWNVGVTNHRGHSRHWLVIHRTHAEEVQEGGGWVAPEAGQESGNEGSTWHGLLGLAVLIAIGFLIYALVT